jgi:hypothetical protein
MDAILKMCFSLITQTSHSLIDIYEYKWDKSIINKRGEAELCNHTSLLMMRYHTVLYNILSTTAQN